MSMNAEKSRPMVEYASTRDAATSPVQDRIEMIRPAVRVAALPVKHGTIAAVQKARRAEVRWTRVARRSVLKRMSLISIHSEFVRYEKITSPGIKAG